MYARNKGPLCKDLSVCVSIDYEDDKRFEELNDVELEEVSSEVQEQLDYIELLHHQQEQQQQ